jgi:nucleoside-diphosphate-sugar epimerase
MDVFLTGATGYIGGAIADALLRAGHGQDPWQLVSFAFQEWDDRLYPKHNKRSSSSS